jgi:DNA (cytosine-5)-methyltransferase 1
LFHFFCRNPRENDSGCTSRFGEVSGTYWGATGGMTELSFYEFFAGGGMARAGLGPAWTCLFANDFDHRKSDNYERFWGGSCLKTGDVRGVKLDDIPGEADLAWASFPCQDLSLAGGGAGLKGDRSGTFWPFWRLMTELISDRRAPRIIALENVCGTLTSHGGKDFAAICSAFANADYKIGAMVVDASLFLPQSRPRLFIVGVREDCVVPSGLTQSAPLSPWHPRGLCTAYDIVPATARANWLWWSPPPPPPRTKVLADIVEEDPFDVGWHTPVETRRILAMMSDLNREKVEAAKNARRRLIGTLYKRTRFDGRGGKIQRAEVRFDDLAGCLRTPAGGSSRQLILIVEGDTVRTRLMSGREAARLMGLPESYRLPENYNEAYHLAGDGVVVPVVRHLARHIFEPIVINSANKARAAA